ncbi:MauE/DoxX family redox-associated membrane protein [Pseudonocardia endophytica]|uniref:Methylamine utilization protein MauE n=1 Tax=Pseudonocardia endophytica TaxID=401976 RepID=A0A4R1I3W9_PSEEN|nr:MauE/DoxX family redox-associated membrane protein [Pseudonocardia endophytica]TCK27209.1 methylamine utilization protein MauE [Pseudonocardia endophytica]
MNTCVGTESRAAVAVPWLVLGGRLVLGGTWIVAGALKVTDLDASVRAVRAYRILPEIAAQLLGAGLPFIEIVLGVLLVVGLGVRVAGIASVLLMGAFVIGIASAWTRGLQIDCGCFGSGGALAAGVSPTYGTELARDVGLTVVAVLVAGWPSGRLALDDRLGAVEEKD